LKNKIYELIKPWAEIPTWHTSHPLDQKRFSKAIYALVTELGPNIDMDDFEKALREHAKDTPATLGSPEHWDSVIRKYALKADTIFTYEQEKNA
jgi:hypothetical protein